MAEENSNQDGKSEDSSVKTEEKSSAKATTTNVAANAGAGGMVAPGGKANTTHPVPSAGVAGKKEGDKPVGRRDFNKWLGFGWLSYVGMSGVGLLGMLRFMLPNVLFEPPMIFRAGKPAEFAPGQVDERYKDTFGVWIVRQGDVIFALSTVCTHLGCTPNWFAGEGKFKCPCHGSGFYINGINFEGPAPRPLERYAVKMSSDGFVMVDKTKIFQQEKGQWDSADSYLNV
jgi:cytochrome b6-f complex iron-sulfur subunit